MVLRAATEYMSCVNPLTMRLTPTMVPMAHVELLGQGRQITYARSNVTMPSKSLSRSFQKVGVQKDFWKQARAWLIRTSRLESYIFSARFCMRDPRELMRCSWDSIRTWKRPTRSTGSIVRIWFPSFWNSGERAWTPSPISSNSRDC